MDNFNNDENKNNDYKVPVEFKVQDNYIPPERPKKSNRLVKYVVVGIVCSMVGGIASGGALLYLLPKSSAFKNTPLYQSLAQTPTYTDVGSTSSSLKASATSTLGSSGKALSVSDIAKKVGPAVVGVSTKTVVQNSDAYSNFFGYSGKNGNSSSEEDGMGSGIIINSQGYILTNNHVISGADKINVIFNNKKEVPAKVINYDAAMDLAIIKITDSSVKVPGVAELGSSSSMSVGDPVVAIGNPLGEDLLGTVTTGVISALNRQISTDENSSSKQTYIQTDAAINPGNSGGPLVNSLGQVIGINSAKIGGTSGGTSVEGIGFSIPIDLVKTKISSLLKPILKLGITAEDIDSDTAKQNSIPVGIYVQQVEDFSPAQKAGIQAGDVIVKFDGKKVTTTEQLNSLKEKHSSGDVVEIQVSRDGSLKTLSLKLSTN